MFTPTTPEQALSALGEMPQAIDRRAMALASLMVHEHVDQEELTLYRAAYPGYPGNFTRDSLTASMLMGDKTMLTDQVRFSARYQGTQYDAFTGEEPGKIHHELIRNIDGSIGGMHMNELSSAYNACDTTAQFLQAVAVLAELEGPHILHRYSTNIEAAVGYIKSHIRDGLFYEMPLHGENWDFALRVTYWKDSRLNVAGKAKPHYPITYSLAHFQNAEGLRAIGEASGQEELVQLGNTMTRTGIMRFWHQDHFAVAVDGLGTDAHIIDHPSSDSLHSLAYIPPELLPSGYALAIEHYSKHLETESGYISALHQHAGDDIQDDYHTEIVWPHDNAKIHVGARRHDLLEVQQVTGRVLSHFGNIFPELIPVHRGNQIQLWGIATHKYYENPDNSFYIQQRPRLAA